MPRDPERPPVDIETDKLSQILSGMHKLSSAGGVRSATEFATETLSYVRREGIEVDGFVMATVLRHSFGEPKDLLERIEDRTPEELDEILPGEIYKAALDYLKPLFDQE